MGVIKCVGRGAGAGTSRCDVPGRVQRAERMLGRTRITFKVVPLDAARTAPRIVSTAWRQCSSVKGAHQRDDGQVDGQGYCANDENQEDHQHRLEDAKDFFDPAWDDF